MTLLGKILLRLTIVIVAISISVCCFAGWSALFPASAVMLDKAGWAFRTETFGLFTVIGAAPVMARYLVVAMFRSLAKLDEP